MITLKTLNWDYMFSYGSGNKIHLDANPITQIVGKNGHGKSSIPLVLEEALFNKNSKGIKRAHILNRYTNSKSYTSYLEFDKDGDIYTVSSTRSSTQTIKITKNGEDISAHTASATFDLLENILGMDHKAFSQIVYQSSSKSLEFLTATDVTRKKFLIDLLNLSKYTEIFDKLKITSKQVNEEMLAVQRSVDMVTAWLDKNSNEDLTIKEIEEVPILDTNITSELHKLNANLLAADDTNKRITKNNQYKVILDSINVVEASTPLPASIDTTDIVSERTNYQRTLKDADLLIQKVSSLGSSCPTCLQKVSKEFIDGLLLEQKSLKESTNALLVALNKEIEEADVTNKAVATKKKLKESWESYFSLFDKSLPTELLDKSDISDRMSTLSNNIALVEKRIKEITAKNKSNAAHNARVEVIMEQMSSMQADLAKYSSDLKEVSERSTNLQILQKAFSTSGLVAYKIECMVKDLEELVNKYLAELSDGRFQITFKVIADKLNVIVTDNGEDIDILALSNGELARVNTATLLAIRKLLQQLSSTRINLLVLDETIDSLDAEGKEKLVEVLLKEEHLNTFLISHGYTHALLEKLHVIKENKISRIEI